MPDRRKLTLFTLMAVGQFMALLDTQIVAASISDIQAGPRGGADESSWVQTAYPHRGDRDDPLSGWLSRAFLHAVALQPPRRRPSRWRASCAASPGTSSR